MFTDAVFYAKVIRKDVGGAGHEHICKADRSPNVRPAP